MFIPKILLFCFCFCCVFFLREGYHKIALACNGRIERRTGKNIRMLHIFERGEN